MTVILPATPAPAAAEAFVGHPTTPQSPPTASLPTLYAPPDGHGTAKRVTVRDLQTAKHAGERWPMLTAYDATTARIIDDTGVPAILVGDSAATLVYGYDTTVQVKMREMLPLVAGVVRGTRRALIVADMPFGSYQPSVKHALKNATRFLRDAGAHAIKLEGGTRVIPQVRALVDAGIPVMGHLGLTPQSVHALGGYTVQGRTHAAADALLRDALAVQDAGAFAIVLEVIPSDLAATITRELTIPTVGIGAGSGTDAQILVWQDLAGLTPTPHPKFVRPYTTARDTLTTAITTWSHDVRHGAYPDDAHTYH